MQWIKSQLAQDLEDLKPPFRWTYGLALDLAEEISQNAAISIYQRLERASRLADILRGAFRLRRESGESTPRVLVRVCEQLRRTPRLRRIVRDALRPLRAASESMPRSETARVCRNLRKVARLPETLRHESKRRNYVWTTLYRGMLDLVRSDATRANECSLTDDLAVVIEDGRPAFTQLDLDDLKVMADRLRRESTRSARFALRVMLSGKSIREITSRVAKPKQRTIDRRFHDGFEALGETAKRVLSDEFEAGALKLWHAELRAATEFLTAPPDHTDLDKGDQNVPGRNGHRP